VITTRLPTRPPISPDVRTTSLVVRPSRPFLQRGLGPPPSSSPSLPIYVSKTVGEGRSTRHRYSPSGVETGCVASKAGRSHSPPAVVCHRRHLHHLSRPTPARWLNSTNTALRRAPFVFRPKGTITRAVDYWNGHRDPYVWRRRWRHRQVRRLSIGAMPTVPVKIG
jgi:hypothetical protein